MQRKRQETTSSDKAAKNNKQRTASHKRHRQPRQHQERQELSAYYGHCWCRIVLCVFWHLTKKCTVRRSLRVCRAYRAALVVPRSEDRAGRHAATKQRYQPLLARDRGFGRFAKAAAFFSIRLLATACTALDDDGCPSERAQLLALVLCVVTGLVIGVTRVAAARADARVAAARAAARDVVRASARASTRADATASW